MKRPFCNQDNTRVVDSRPIEDSNAIRRRRMCDVCGRRFTTYEKVETIPLIVIKKDMNREQYDRSKIETGILRACHKRPVSAEKINEMVNKVETELFNGEEREIPSSVIGEKVMHYLKDLDQVAYVRFASIYREFKDVNTFMDELKKIIHPYDDEDYDYEEDFEEPVKESRSPFEERREDRRSEERRSEDRHNKVVNIHATTQLKVVLVKPERFENASEIADHLKEKRTVVLNLESTNKDVARRLIDFLSGVAYAGEGKIKKVAANTYIITPYSVDIMGDLIDELENNGLYL